MGENDKCSIIVFASKTENSSRNFGKSIWISLSVSLARSLSLAIRTQYRLDLQMPWKLSIQRINRINRTDLRIHNDAALHTASHHFCLLQITHLRFTMIFRCDFAVRISQSVSFISGESIWLFFFVSSSVVLELFSNGNYHVFEAREKITNT